MARVANLTAIVRREVEDYARGETWKAITYPLSDIVRRHFAVLVIPDHDFPLPERAGIVVAARIVGDYVVVDEDITDRPLLQELVRAGIPRDKIICSYAGEKLPDSAQSGPNREESQD